MVNSYIAVGVISVELSLPDPLSIRRIPTAEILTKGGCRVVGRYAGLVPEIEGVGAESAENYCAEINRYMKNGVAKVEMRPKQPASRGAWVQIDAASGQRLTIEFQSITVPDYLTEEDRNDRST